MKKSLMIGLAGLVVVAVLAVTARNTVFAQEATPTPEAGSAAPQAPGKGWHRGMRYDSVTLEAAAKALGMTTEELSNELWAGRTLADLAEKAGVSLSDLRSAVEQARLQATRDAIAQAVKDGTMTQDKANWLLEVLDKGYWSGFGGRGRFRGPGGMGFPADQGAGAPGLDW